MKIEFEFTASYEGSLEIDGKKLGVQYRGGMWSIIGLTDTERENTFGGIVAQELLTELISIMQASCTVADEQADTWTVLPEHIAEKVANEIW